MNRLLLRNNSDILYAYARWLYNIITKKLINIINIHPYYVI